VTEVAGFFDKLYFTDSTMKQPHISTEQLRVPISGLLLLKGHPLECRGYGPYRGELIFNGVVTSQRTLIEYIGDRKNPSGFGPAKKVADAFSHRPMSPHGERFSFEGLILDPDAWVDEWLVVATEFKLLVE
jgi:hypothetical protein